MSDCIHAEDVLVNVKRHPTGYRRVARNGRWILCHRLVFEECFGDPGELMILHSCDNRSCVNPEHLRSGTAKENTADMVSRRRCWSGPRKITEDQAREIRSSKISNRELAKTHGISSSQVSRIKSGKKWKQI